MKMQGIPLGEFLATRVPAINPAQHADEEFELFSVPAFDIGAPERLAGRQIGSAKKLVQPDDVLLSRIVPHIRRAWVVPPKNGARQIASGEWIIFRDRYLHSAYARFYLTSDQFHAQFMRTVAGVGGSLLRARSDAVGRIEIPLPPLDEQRRIAAILDKADAIRRRRRQALAEIDNLLRASYLDLVGCRHPDFETWPLYRVAELAEERPGAMRTGPFGSDLRHSEFVDEGVAVLGIDNAVRNRFAWDERRFITSEKYERLQRYRVFPGDVIITIMGTTGRSAVVPDDIPEAITTKHLATISPNRKLVLPEVLSFAIHSDPLVIRQIQRANKGAIMAGLNLGIIKELELRLAPLDLQERFADVARRLSAKAEKLADDDLSGEHLFVSLSQRAFRGEL